MDTSPSAWKQIIHTSSTFHFMASLRNSLLTACALLALTTCAIAPSLCAELPEKESPATAGSFFDVQIDPNAESNFSLAEFRLWIPELKTPVKGVLAVLSGSDADGIPLANDPHWQAIAANWNYALLSVTFTTCSSARPYYRAEYGSGQTLLSALDQIAAKSGHPEIKGAPIAILGYSQGGQFAVHLACWQPARVIAFAAIKGGYYDVTPTDAARAVPGLLITAAKDEEFRQKNIRALFDRNRTPDARWAFASEPNAGHEPGRSLQLIIPFFDAVISRDLRPCTGDLSDLRTTPAEHASEPGHPWLPNQNVAEIWTRLMTGALQHTNAELCIPRERPPLMTQTSPTSHDFGILENRREPPLAIFHVKPRSDGPPWTSIRAFSPRSRCEVSVSGSGDDWIVSVRPNLDEFPLGRMGDTIQIRYSHEGRPILGGTELHVTFNHIDPAIRLSSSSFYLGVHSRECRQTLTITSAIGAPLKIQSVELLSGVAATFTIVQETTASANVVAAFLPLSESGNHSGIVAIHLAQPIPATVLIPFIGVFSAPP
jgi:poly(3-hydroxybutyrate) depolymerase